MDALDRIITGTELFDLLNGKEVTCLSKSELEMLARSMDSQSTK